ncbi:hypothetical protein NPIL_505291, partial [Nephila pilipes]
RTTRLRMSSKFVSCFGVESFKSPLECVKLHSSNYTTKVYGMDLKGLRNQKTHLNLLF